MMIRDEASVISVDDLRKRLSYDPTTGVLRWLPVEATDRFTRRWNTRFAGTIAGSLAKRGYISITLRIGGRNYAFRAHRIAWAIVTGEWPDGEIDHRNNIRSDNRFKNLRQASHSENGKSKSMNKRNSTGLKGVTKRIHRTMVSYRAQILLNGKKINIGAFDTPEKAAAAYDTAAKQYFGEFAKTNRSMGLL